jgi:hypothetical protein
VNVPQFDIIVGGDPNISGQSFSAALYKQTSTYLWSNNSLPIYSTYSGHTLFAADNPHRLVAYSTAGVDKQSLYAESIFSVTAASGTGSLPPGASQLAQILSALQKLLIDLTALLGR